MGSPKVHAYVPTGASSLAVYTLGPWPGTPLTQLPTATCTRSTSNLTMETLGRFHWNIYECSRRIFPYKMSTQIRSLSWVGERYGLFRLSPMLVTHTPTLGTGKVQYLPQLSQSVTPMPRRPQSNQPTKRRKMTRMIRNPFH